MNARQEAEEQQRLARNQIQRDLGNLPPQPQDPQEIQDNNQLREAEEEEEKLHDNSL